MEAHHWSWSCSFRWRGFDGSISPSLRRLSSSWRGVIEGVKGFCLTDLTDPDMLENWDAAARKANQPLMVQESAGGLRTLGVEPSPGNLGGPQVHSRADECKSDGVCRSSWRQHHQRQHEVQTALGARVPAPS